MSVSLVTAVPRGGIRIQIIDGAWGELTCAHLTRDGRTESMGMALNTATAVQNAIDAYRAHRVTRSLVRLERAGWSNRVRPWRFGR